MALTDKLIAIANAIRGKTGGTDKLSLDGMMSAIEGISIDGYKKSDIAYTLKPINDGFSGDLAAGAAKYVKGNYLSVTPSVDKTSRHLFISEGGELLVSYKNGGTSVSYMTVCILNMSDASISISTLDYVFYEYIKSN